ncbi:hypothetical protein, partial [Aeromonas caviae]
MRRALESVYQIISSLSHSSGQGYFDAFVSEIANAVGADFVLVSGKDQAGLMRWSPPPCERYADRVFFFQERPSWKTLRLLVLISV